MARNQQILVMALGVWGMVGLTPAWAEEPVTPLLRDGEHEVTVQDYQQMLLALPDAKSRARYQHDVQLSGELLRYIDQRKRLAAEAERLDLTAQPEVQARLAVARRQILSDALLEHHRSHLQYPDFTELAREHYLARQQEYEAAGRDFEAVKAELIEQLRNKYIATQMTDYQARFKTSPEAVLDEAWLNKQLSAE